MNVYAFQDYKEALRERIEENKERYGYKTQLAKAAGCQKSFLSQVLNANAHFTPDHALGVAKFWSFSTLEREYFLALVHHARAGSRDLKQHLHEQLEDMRRRSERDAMRSTNRSVSERWHPVYFASWQYAAVHMATTIPRLRTVRAIAERLALSEPRVESVLASLAEMKLVERKAGQWRPLETMVHLDQNTPYKTLQQISWGRKAAEDSASRSDPDNLHFTAVYTLSRKDYERVRAMLLEFLEKTRKIVAPSPEEELICVATSLFVL